MKSSRRKSYIRVIEYKRITSRALPIVLDDPKTVAEAARQIGAFKNDGKERFGVFLLDSASQIIGFHLVSVGSVDRAIVTPKEVFGPALRELGCCRVILVHNHPAGDPRPSLVDVKLTRDLCKAGNLLGIEVVDHVVLASGSQKFSSLAQDGQIRSASHTHLKAASP